MVPLSTPPPGRRAGGNAKSPRSSTTRQLIDLARDAIIVRDLSPGIIQVWSKGAERLYGWPASQAKGLVIGTLLHTQYPRPIEEILDVLVATGDWDGQLLHQARDGRTVVVESRWTLRRDRRGGPAALLEINSDITARTQVAEELQHTQARYENLLESAPDAILLTETTGRIVLVNAQAELLFGYTKQELLHLCIDDLLPEQLRAAHVQHRAEYGENPRSRPMGMGLNLHARRKDGRLVPVEISLSPVVSANEHLVTAILRDVSERKQLEEERLRAELAERALRQQGEFLSVAAHELKTPLTSLLGFADALRQAALENTDIRSARNQKALSTISRQADKLHLLVNQLLDVSRIDAGRLALALAPCDLVPMAQEVVLQAQSRTAAHQIALLAPPTLLLLADSLRLEQVLNNLVENAIKYSPGGGSIRVLLASTEGGARMAVRDQGLGIAEADRPHIFDRYYQAHKASYRSGMGLGLFISQQIMQMHGGRIWATFPPEGGTEMIAEFPGSCME